MPQYQLSFIRPRASVRWQKHRRQNLPLREQEAEIKTDFLGDPLPPHALIRLGTNRFNPSDSHGGVALSADDQIAITLGNVLVALDGKNTSPFARRMMAWDANSGKLLWQQTTSIHQASRTGAAAYGSRQLCRMPKSGQLVTLGQPGAIEFWDFMTGDKTSLQTATKEPFKSIDVSPDDSLIAAGGPNLLLVCDLSGKEKFRIENHPKVPLRLDIQRDRLSFGGDFSYARFAPNGKLLALVNSEFPKTLQILKTTSGGVRRKIKTRNRIVRLDFTNDGQYVVTTERDVAARMYNSDTGKLVWEKVFFPSSAPGMDERYTTDVQVSPNGDLVAVGTAIGEDQRIQLLDPKTGESVGALTGHTWKPWCLQFTADGRQMFSTGWDGVIRRWDIENANRFGSKIRNVPAAFAQWLLMVGRLLFVTTPENYTSSMLRPERN